MKKTLFLFAALTMAFAMNAQVSVWDGSASIWTQGNGTANDPYLIESAENLAYLSNIVNANSAYATTWDVFADTCFVLTTDLDLGGANGLNWNPIGKSDATKVSMSYFAGHFDGGGHTIYNMRVVNPEEDNSNVSLGLFGCAQNGSIRSINLAPDCTITMTEVGLYTENCGMGGILGYGVNMTLEGCVSAASVLCEYLYSEMFGTPVGGVFGFLKDSSVSNCHNSGNVTGNVSSIYGPVSVAGVVSYANNCDISDCSNSGIVVCQENGDIHNECPSSSGIVGAASGNCIVTRCHNVGKIVSITPGDCIFGAVGAGIVGSNYKSSHLRVRDCYCVADITASTSTPSYAGGIVGYIDWEGTSEVYNCYYVGTTDAEIVGGIIGGEDETTTQTVANSFYIDSVESSNEYGVARSEENMKSQDFVNELNAEEQVFMSDEQLVNQGYPVFYGVNYEIGDEEISPSAAVSVYPNPASSFIIIKSDVQPQLVEVYSIDGRKMTEQNFNFSTVNLSILNAGVYLIKITLTDGRTFTERVVVGN